MNPTTNAINAVKALLESEGISVMPIRASEWFFGLEFVLGSRRVASVCQDDGLNFEGPALNGKQKAAVRAYAALYYGN